MFITYLLTVFIISIYSINYSVMGCVTCVMFYDVGASTCGFNLGGAGGQQL